MDKTFEDYLSFIEDELGIQLLDWQKEFLQQIYNGKTPYYMPGRAIGRKTVGKAEKILNKLMAKENSNETN